MEMLKFKTIIFILVTAAMGSGCAGPKSIGEGKGSRDARARLEGQVKAWGQEYASVLAQYEAAETTAEISAAVVLIKQLRDSAPSVTQELATRDLCAVSAATGDLVILTAYGCMDREPLRKLLR